jgi:DNA mismatch repair protein MutL
MKDTRAIRRLGEGTINRIAAGEVVERPASVVKELVENALDAGARRVAITIADGGMSLILVEDDGDGMDAASLTIAIERHATSKLPLASDGSDDLTHIATLGFRGEALPSIGAVARVRIVSRTKDSAAHTIAVAAGAHEGPEPAGFLSSGQHGTRVEVRDLFFATPARLKFLKSSRAESLAVIDVVRRLAMARPDVAFVLTDDGRVVFSLAAEETLFDGSLRRLSKLMGREFADNAAPIAAEREHVKLSGFAGLPTYNRANAQSQFLFVNGRPVRDRVLLGAVKGAYADYLARDRHPAVALFLACDPEFVDVNVHPAKAEVRFRDSGLVRGLIVGALKAALHQESHRASSTLADAALSAFRVSGHAPANHEHRRFEPVQTRFAGLSDSVRHYDATPLTTVALAPAPQQEDSGQDHAYEHAPDHEHQHEAAPLGAARAQLHETYIVAETEDGLVIVDQHAAHERLVYERMKRALENGGVKRQSLLIPEVVELEESEAARLVARAEELAALGLVLESFGPGAVLVRETPALLGELDAKALIRDIADELAETESLASLKERLGHARLSRQRALGPTAQCRRDERAAARDGIDAPFRAVQPRPADLCRFEACRY